MNIVKPYANLLQPIDASDGLTLLKKIEWCGRISHRSEEAQKEDTWQRFIQSVVLEHGDWSIVEHASATVDFYVDRGITHEIVRHRLFSYTQESTRFVNYEKKMPPSFIAPPINLSIDDGEGMSSQESAEDWWNNSITYAEQAYQGLIKAGCSPQIARSVFPNALASRLIVTGNLRNWRHFFIMRTTREAHPQMREVTIPLLTQFKERIPLLYDDIEPLSKQSEGMKRAR